MNPIDRYLQDMTEKSLDVVKKLRFMFHEIDELDVEFGHTMTWFLSCQEAQYLSDIKKAFLIICETATFELRCDYLDNNGHIIYEHEYMDKKIVEDDILQIRFRVFFNNGPVRLDLIRES